MSHIFNIKDFKMKKRKGLLASLSLIALMGTSLTFAGNRPGAVTLTFGDAYYKFDSERHVDATAMPNFELAYNVTDHIGIEGTFGVLNSNLSAPLNTGELEGDPAHGFLYTIDGVYRFANYKIIEPYVTVGIGEVGLKPSGYESVQQGLVNAGIGAQAFFDKSLALRAEFRELYTTTGSGFNDYFVNFGISYLIGGEESSAIYKDG
jgi:hypothetical protein